MDEKTNQLIIIVKKTIVMLNQRMKNDAEKPILETLYNRYQIADKILMEKGDMRKIMIKGGCRAYLDAYSDYLNPMLIEMDKAEELLSDILG